MRRLTICCPKQWGYHIDSYKMALYFQDQYRITYVCWDHGYKKVNSDKVNVLYVSRRGSLVARNLRFLRSIHRHLSDVKPDICFIKYYVGCSLSRLRSPAVNYVFDVRSASVNEDPVNRLLYNLVLRTEARFFTNITVISSGLARHLRLENRSTVLPLGSSVVSTVNKSFRDLKLLYVGTLNNRNISETIEGVADFQDRYGAGIVDRYTIVGDGREYDLLKKKIEYYGLSDVVELKGRIPHCELRTLLDEHNVGVSYVPRTRYYDHQPVGKTFDYLLSGLAVLATSTSENSKVINGSNGVCIDDNAAAFAEGLHRIWRSRNKYDSCAIRKLAMRYSWDHIFQQFSHYLEARLDKASRDNLDAVETQ